MGKRLQEALLSAHAADDRLALVALYAEAADLAERDQDIEKACFFLTHAWIFALETGHEKAGILQDRLRERGRV
ncbi:MAG: hypothetical protein KJN60_12540 [Boseongicola sp.]|nr:hypothetical protein [Boseongicola sp.]